MNNGQSDSPCRIILANQPRLLRKMLQRAIDHTPGLQVVGEVTDPGRIASVVKETGAHWVVLSLRQNGGMPDVTAQLIAQCPGLRVLAVAPDGSHAKALWSGPLVESLDDVSLDDLLATLRKRWTGEMGGATG